MMNGPGGEFIACSSEIFDNNIRIKKVYGTVQSLDPVKIKNQRN